MATTGRTLRVERLKSEVTVTALAARMGLSRQSLWALERMAAVRPDRVELYRRSLRDVIGTTEDVA